MIVPRLAIIGSGHLGRIHARLAKAGGLLNLVAVVDPISSAREALAAELDVIGVGDFRELSGLFFDAAIVATPTATHCDVAVDLLRQGVHTFVEKPLAATTIQAARMVEAAQRAGVVLQVGHVERFNPAWVALKPGWSQAWYFEANRASAYSFRSTDVGVIHDLMIHDLDLVLSKCPAPVIDVSASVVTVIGPHEDVAHARLEFADGRVALLRASRVSNRAERTMQLYASLGHVVVDFSEPSTTVFGRCPEIQAGRFDPGNLTPRQRQEYQRDLFQSVLPVESLTLEKRNAIADEQLDFVESIQTGRLPVVCGTQGLRAVRVAQQILDAANRSTLRIDRFSSRQIA